MECNMECSDCCNVNNCDWFYDNFIAPIEEEQRLQEEHYDELMNNNRSF